MNHRNPAALAAKINFFPKCEVPHTSRWSPELAYPTWQTNYHSGTSQHRCRTQSQEGEMNATSLTDPTSDYTVFISHRIKDKHVAYSIKDLLAQHTANVDYIVSEDIEKGENWRKIITTQL